MFNALLKKRNSNKGFTLIELIVVIAILAILAMLIVPKFLGFTDNAKIAADKAAVETIEKAVMTLVANGEIIPGTAGGTIGMPDTGAWTLTPATHTIAHMVGATQTVYTEALIETTVQKLTGELNAQADGNAGFSAVVATTGEVTVSITN